MRLELMPRGEHSPMRLAPGEYADGVFTKNSRGRLTWKPSGLGLRVHPSGERSFTIRYRRKIEGDRHRYVIGDATRMGLSDARTQAKTLLVEIDKGKHPAGEARAKRKAKAGEITFADMCTAFMAHGRNRKTGEPLKETTKRQWEGIIENRLLPAFGKRPPGEITPEDVREFLEEIAKETPTMALRVMEAMRRVFSFALSRGKVTTTPFMAVKAVDIAPAPMRQRWLTHDELSALVRALDAKKMGVSDVRSFLLLALLTAARHDEILRAPWSEFDLRGKVWRIPKERHKGGRGHEIPLSPWAVSVLTELRARHPESAFIFPDKTGTGPRVSMQRAIESFRDGLGLDEWRVHDLRRTVADEVSKLKVGDRRFGPHIVEALLGHTNDRLEKTYRSHVPVDEIGEALDAWALKLREIAKKKGGKR